MKEATLLIAFAVISAVLGSPLQREDQPAVPISDLSHYDAFQEAIDGVLDLQQKVHKIRESLEEAVVNIPALEPHVIHKRQTTVSGSADHGPGGSSSSVGLSHSIGDTTFNAHASQSPSGFSRGAGIRHETDNGHLGASVFQDSLGTLNRIDGSRSWNDGNTRVGGFLEQHSSGASSVGGSFRHQTDDGFLGASVAHDPFGTSTSVEAGHTFNNGNSEVSGFFNGHSSGQNRYGGSLTHRFGDGYASGSIERDPFGISNRVDIGRTWNDGNTRLGGYFSGHSSHGNSGGLSFSHRF